MEATDPSHVDEPIALADYDPRWQVWYEADAAELVAAAGDQLRAVEHFGSTAVPGACAKPIIDILAAFVEWTPFVRETLQALGYEYLGEAGVPGRQYFRRRAQHSTNVAVVEWGGQLWTRNIALRDYLRAHPQVALEYSEEKRRAWTQGARTLLHYSQLKGGYVAQLVDRAERWASMLSQHP